MCDKNKDTLYHHRKVYCCKIHLKNVLKLGIWICDFRSDNVRPFSSLSIGDNGICFNWPNLNVGYLLPRSHSSEALVLGSTTVEK